MLYHSTNSGCNSLLLPNAFLNRPELPSGIEINLLLWVGYTETIRLETVKCLTHKRSSPSHIHWHTNIFTAAHPFLTMMTTAPRSRMSTTRPPTQAPRIRPMSSACWDTSRARLESLQAAAQHDREVRKRRRNTKSATVNSYLGLIVRRCYMQWFDASKLSLHSFKHKYHKQTKLLPR